VSLLVSWLPFIALIGVWIFLSRRCRAAPARRWLWQVAREDADAGAWPRERAKTVAGVDEAKQEPAGDRRIPARPRQVPAAGRTDSARRALCRPAGTGKTLIARRSRAKPMCRFFTISGSDFVEMFRRVGASRVRDMFEQAKKNAPCIIFIDEIDAVGRHRGAGSAAAMTSASRRSTSCWSRWTGFEANEGVILIAATNRPDVLDPARASRPLRPPGVVPNPDVGGREQILRFTSARCRWRRTSI